MAHFAKLDENNEVIEVIVISNEMLQDDNGNEVEQLGIDFCESLFGQNTIWKQTSFNGNIRKQYAGIGMLYDETNDVFLTEQPFASWSLDSNFDWQPPVVYPTDHKFYTWNEDDQTWDEFIPNQPFDSWTWNEPSLEWQPPIDYPSDYDTVGYQWNEETLSWDEVGDCLDCQ